MDLYPIFLPTQYCDHKSTLSRSYMRQVLLMTLSYHLGREITTDDLTVDIHGKPSLGSGNIHFSISHSGNWFYVLTSDADVGVDIEKCKSRRSAKVLSDFLALRCDGPLRENNDLAIARTWSRLEALTKCVGLGMTVSLEGIRVPAELLFRPVLLSTSFGHHWLVDLPSVPGYCAAAVSVRKPEYIRVLPLNFS